MTEQPTGNDQTHNAAAGDWYTDLATRTVHQSEGDAGGTVYSWCRQSKAASAPTAAPAVGDGMCALCPGILLELGKEVIVPFDVCLGCDSVQPSDNQGVAAHETGDEPAQCIGSNQIAALFDGHDRVRRFALRHFVSARRHCDRGRAALSEMIARGHTPYVTILSKEIDGFASDEIVAEYWKQLLYGGDFRVVAVRALRTMLQFSSSDQARVAGEAARRWLNSVSMARSSGNPLLGEGPDGEEFMIDLRRLL